MKQISKVFSKKLFGARYEQLKRTLPVWLILFFSFSLSGIRIRIAPSVLYLTVCSFSAGIMWRLLTTERNTGDMRHLFLLPFDNRSLVFSYVSVLGVYTLLTKTAGLFAILFAVCPWSKTEMLCALLGSVFAVLMTACIFTLIEGRNVHSHIRAHATGRIMSLFWPAAFLAAILFRPEPPVLLPVITGGSLHASILLSNVDAYTFYGADQTYRRRVRSGRHALAWRYLVRYLLSHKNYLLNTVILWGIACVLPVFFVQAGGSFALPIGFAVLSMNTPICILLSCDPSFEQALRFLPHQAKAFLIPYCLFIFICSLSADMIFLCSYALQAGGIRPSSCLLATAFALSGAIGSVLLEWFFPLRNWKTENDLWHHPRKYVVPVTLLVLAGITALL